MVPGCPPSTCSVEGSCCWGTEQGQGASGGWRSPSFLCLPLGRSRRAPVAAMCLRWIGGLWAAGGAAPPAPCTGLGSAAGSLGRVSAACGPPDSGLAADPGREAADELDALPAAWWGSA